MDCDNLRKTSQKIIVDTFAPIVSVTGEHRRRRGSRRQRGSRARSQSIWEGIQ